MKRIPAQCPACDGELAITRLSCQTCETEMTGVFQLPALLRLAPEEQAFAEAFLLESGSLKAMARRLGVSYPTVRNRLDELIERLSGKRQ